MAATIIVLWFAALLGLVSIPSFDSSIPLKVSSLYNECPTMRNEQSCFHLDKRFKHKRMNRQITVLKIHSLCELN